ncbi:ABC transporter substrate-binding protein [Salisediminibacterium selenitireducens]|uniref:Extracellular solute-binding protein family 1 n=1 Tax=Bacillus selenitireducens (strain ATCC 700615 / DSM 15326 / MLS10) TaxID=439292 RepID=D6Y1H2_BACIE|nr:ABC transporter substrate-binding protein [Salisediminibacterium selenitireducens]ADI00759.1 extracellular solute-binding protein family 1 [[Bacillus] selenitireducens MLS10]
MKKWLTVAAVIPMLSACGDDAEPQVEVETLQDASWDEIVSEAEGKEIGIYMWGGDDGINQYMDDFIAPRLLEEYDVTLNRYPMDAPDFLNKLMTEREAGEMNGGADLLWINAENFRTAKDNDLLYGDFLEILPNVHEYIGTDVPFVNYDTGTPIEGHEAPWGNVQFTIQANPDLVDEMPGSIEELIEWSIENPGLFTYPNVNDFTGNTFVRHVMYHVADDPADLAEYNEAWLEEHGSEVWDVLGSFKDSLWREGQTYPDSNAQLDQMFADGEVAFAMGFNEHRAVSKIEDGIFPENTETLVLEPGSIGNTHYLSVPFNATEPEAALVAINFMLSPEAQIKKLDPSMWGEGHVLNPDALTEEQLEEAEALTGPAFVSQDDILPELDSRYFDWVIEQWERELVQ